MTTMRATRLPVIGLAVLMAGVFGADALLAQSGRQSYLERRADERRNTEGDKIEEPQVLFPEATRAEPKQRATSRFQRQLNGMIESLNEGDAAKALETAKAVAEDERANAYEKSVALQVAGNASSELDDTVAAIDYLSGALEAGGLDNNAHYSTMQNLAAFQANEDRLDDAIATLQRLVQETNTKRPEIHVVLASALFQDERFADAIASVNKAISLAPEPKDEWLRLLQAAYAENDQQAESVKVGEQLLARTPDDKRLVFALASSYLDLEQEAKAEALLQQARTKGLFTEARDYQALYSILFNMDGKEKDVITVIEDGLGKGLLKRDLQTLGALAQAAYFAEDMPKAIATYKEAAALDPKGETGLNYAKVLSAEARDAEARDAAKAALAKGVAKPGEAWMVIARSESQLDNVAATRAALQEAAKFPETREQATKMLQQNR
ncbi:MAG: hypothetical protein ACK5Q0_03015 [Lysobacteraceae bacterium]